MGAFKYSNELKKWFVVWDEKVEKELFSTEGMPVYVVG
jgi:hypothetical protein